jgi:hypothetical protein
MYHTQFKPCQRFFCPLSFVPQGAPTVNGADTNVPNPTSPYTNAINGSNMFFRTVPAN